METNTVVLDIKEYNSLRDFRENVKEGKTFTEYRHYSSGYSVVVYGKEDSVKELMSTIESLREDVKGLKDDKYKTTDQIKRMSIFQFIKWRKQ